MARRFYCNCCGADWAVSGNAADNAQVECPDCGAYYDEDDETFIESYNGDGE
jgi:predicted nucleic acid-binding Zn ribbon protein